MFNTDNTIDHDTDILKMELAVSDTEATAENVDFDEVFVENPDHDGSGPPPLLYRLSPESTPPRNAVLDVLNVLNDPAPFIFGSNLPPMNINHFDNPPMIKRRLLQLNLGSSNYQSSSSNTYLTGSREIQYIILHV